MPVYSCSGDQTYRALTTELPDAPSGITQGRDPSTPQSPRCAEETAPLRMTLKDQDDSVPCKLLLEGEAELFDDRIRQDFASHAPNFSFRFRPG
jgi:hypothetical protein